MSSHGHVHDHLPADIASMYTHGGSGNEDELGASVNLQSSRSRPSDYGYRNRRAIPNNTQYNGRLDAGTQKPIATDLLAPKPEEYSTLRAGTKTPANKSRTPTVSKQIWSELIQNGDSATPHTVRALQRQHATIRQKPSHSRRKSGRNQHETPRNVLRHLSQALAKSTDPIEPSPQLPPVQAFDNVTDNEAESPQPTVSAYLDELSDNECFCAPPIHRSILSVDDPQTERLVEFPRWPQGGEKLARLSRGSLGSSRMSEFFAGPGEHDSTSALWPATDLGAFSAEPSAALSHDLHKRDSAREFYEDEHKKRIGQSSCHSSSSRASQSRKAGPHSRTDQNGDTSFEFEIVHDGGLQNPARSSEDKEKTTSILTRPVPNIHQNFHFSNSYISTAATDKRWSSQRKRSGNNIHSLSLPVGIVKKLASSFAMSSNTIRKKVNKDTLGALVEAGHWFLEQIGNDLGTFADHAGRKRIQDADVTILMKRQRILTTQATPFSLAQQHLPRELLQDIRIVQLSRC